MTVAADVAETVRGLRREVCALHAELVRYQLVGCGQQATSPHASPATTCW